MPSRILKFKTLVQTFLEHFPKSHLVSQIPLKVFGCSAFVYIHSQHRGKFDARAKKCIFVRYSSNKKGYKCYYPTSKKFFHSMDVSFFENIPYFSNFVNQGESHNHESHNWDWSSLIESNQPVTQSNQNWNRPISLPPSHHGVSPQMLLEQSSTSPKSTQPKPPF